MSTNVNLLQKVWEVREQDDTKLGQEDSLGIGMRLTWRNTYAIYICILVKKETTSIEET
jgi:hypothetical protein